LEFWSKNAFSLGLDIKKHYPILDDTLTDTLVRAFGTLICDKDEANRRLEKVKKANKINKDFEFKLAIKRGNVVSVLAEDWELFLVGDSDHGLLVDAGMTIEKISNTLGVQIPSVNGELIRIGRLPGKKTALQNIGLTVLGSCVNPLYQIINNPNSITHPGPYDLVIGTFLLSMALIYGVLTTATIILKS